MNQVLTNPLMTKVRTETELSEIPDKTSKCTNVRLSVIIPFRADPLLPYLLDRLEDQCKSFPRHNEIEFIVVDSGSDVEFGDRCIEICEQNDVEYLYHDSLGQTFSIGAARDFGVQHANGKAVTFLDVDLRVANDFWDRLLVLMTSYGISEYKKRFLAIPCLYLTEDGTEEFFDSDHILRFQDFYLRWLHGDTESVQTLAPCSSVMIVDRLHYLSIGGHRPEFRGHGYEDFELYHRLIGEEGVLRTAHSYYKDTKSWNTATYNGFRSQFSLLGRTAMMSNLFVIHLWHPRPKTSSFYSGMSVNREIWMDFFKEFDRTKEHPSTLPDLTKSKKKVLFFGKPGTNAVNCLRYLFPLLGNGVFVSEYDFVDSKGELAEDEFEEMLHHHGIDEILFPNPYGNEVRLSIYRWCRKVGFPYFVFERGALPDSWFLDHQGFNADSESYDEKNWAKPLKGDDRKQIIDYIKNTISGHNALEKQGSRLSAEGIANRLQIGGKKVLFVPLQRPSDTVIRYLLGDLASYDHFLKFIDETARFLKRKGWVVLCKKHPLETEEIPLRYAQYAPEDTHFIDLLELADSVALINSGVGVYSMMMNKPTYVFGDAFYSFEGINENVLADSSEKFASQIISGYSVDTEKVYQFIHYLKNSFYSYGINKTKMRKESDGSLRSLTTGIDFYRINIKGKRLVDYSVDCRKSIPSSAPLYERFALDLHNKKKNAAKPNKPSAAINTTAKTPVKAKIAEKQVKHKKTKEEIQAAKIAKFKNNPKAFFKDSKLFFLRPIKYIFS